MSSPAITVAPDVSVVAAARLLDRHHVRRLLVAEAGGRLAGIVTPHDLLRVYLRSDEEIRDEIVNDILVHYLATNPALAKVTVTDGVVTLAGELGQKSMIPIAIRMTQAVDGVVDVVGQLRFAVDDTYLRGYVDTSMDRARSHGRTGLRSPRPGGHAAVRCRVSRSPPAKQSASLQLRVVRERGLATDLDQGGRVDKFGNADRGPRWIGFRQELGRDL
jgi:CBS domain-containing protein